MYDVAIIGYGPVGATLANLLGQYGHRVAVIEQRLDIFPIPRAVHCDDEAQRIWQAAGVLDKVTPSFGGYPPDRQYINAQKRIYFATKLNPARPFGHQLHMYFHQPMLEEGLRAGVESHKNIDLFLGHSAIDLTQNEQSATVLLEEKSSAAKQQITAKYIVGCDGARSFVRKTLRIGLEDLNFDQPWLVTDFYLKPGLSREDVGFPYAHQQICDPAQPISFIPNGVKGHYRFEFMLQPGTDKNTAEDPAYVQNMLGRVVDVDKIDIVRGAVYTFHSLIAQQWRDRRIFIAGDAAHQMPPFAGQGMVSGLRDIHNLAWKLSFVLNGYTSPNLLDSYEAERKPHVTRMTRGAMFLGNLVQTQSPARAWLRDLLFSTMFKIPALFGRIVKFALRAPSLKTPLSGGMHQLAGTPFIQPEVTLPSGEVKLLDDLMGSGVVVIGYLTDATSFTNALQSALPVQIINIGPDSVDDHTGKLSAWFKEHEVDVVVVRPDRFIFGGYAANQFKRCAAELTAKLQLR